MERLRSNFGGSHTVVTYPPLDALNEINADLAKSSCVGLSAINLYIHIAFCEFICPFCHYETTFSDVNQISGRTARYMEALFKEIALWQNTVPDTISSIYIGGGTPTILPISMLQRLYQKLSEKWTLRDIPFCIETSPTTLNTLDGIDKLKLLKNIGVNRLSIGIQSFSDKLLNRSRKETASITYSALDKIMAAGIPFNIDLIQDLPGQELSDIYHDVAMIQKYQPNQVTWYTLRVQKQAGWHKKIENGTIKLASSEESIERRRVIISLMSQIGYSSQPGGRFSRTHEHDLYKLARSNVSSNLLGIGASAYSHNNKFFFRNSFSGKGNSGIDKYIELMDKSGCAITHGYPMTEYELSASKLVHGIRYGVLLEEIVNSTYFNEVKKNIDLMLTENILETTNGLLHISSDGLPYEEEICSLLYSNEMKKILAANE